MCYSALYLVILSSSIFRLFQYLHGLGSGARSLAPMLNSTRSPVCKCRCACNWEPCT